MKPPRAIPDPSTNFAAAACPEGVRLFHGGSQGLHCAVSKDGIHWRTAAPAPAAAGLRPICAEPENAEGAPNLFCAGPHGRIVAARARMDGVSLQRPFRPLSDPGPWYAELPQADDTAITWDPDARLYRAYFCARRKRGRHPNRLACIGAAVSPDLVKWRAEPPVFAPNRFPRMFTPHVFTHEGRTVLFYATPDRGELRTLRFAVASSPEGPFEKFQNDVLARDCRTRVQTAPTPTGRLVFFGRNLPGQDRPHSVSRPGKLDFHPDGRPFVRFYDPLLNLPGRDVITTDAQINSSEILVRVFPRNAANFRISLRLRSLGATAAGVLFRTNITGSDNIILWVDFKSGALLLRRGVKGRLLARAPRHLTIQTDYRITLWVEGPFADVFLDHEWVLSSHTEARLSGGFGVAVKDGEARFDALSVQTVNPD